MKTPFFENIVWAVDTMESQEYRQNAEFVIGAFTRSSPTKVWPIHILLYPFANPKSATTFEEAYLALSEKRLTKLADDSDLPQMQKGSVFINREGSIRAAGLGPWECHRRDHQICRRK